MRGECDRALKPEAAASPFADKGLRGRPGSPAGTCYGGLSLPGTRRVMPFLLRLACLLCALLLPALAAERIVLANGEWPPYLSAKLPHYGYASHIVSEAFRQAGIEVRYDFYPWARAQEMVRAGTVAGSPVWTATPERQAFALFSEPVISDDEVVFHLRSKPLRWTRMEDLRGLAMVTPLGSKLGAWEAPIRAGILSNAYTLDIRTGFLQLLAGRTDFFPLAKGVGLHALNQGLPPEVAQRITYSPTVSERNEYRLMLSRARPDGEELLRRFNDGLRRLRDSGRLAQMEREFESGAYSRPGWLP